MSAPFGMPIVSTGPVLHGLAMQSGISTPGNQPATATSTNAGTIQPSTSSCTRDPWMAVNGGMQLQTRPDMPTGPAQSWSQQMMSPPWQERQRSTRWTRSAVRSRTSGCAFSSKALVRTTGTRGAWYAARHGDFDGDTAPRLSEEAEASDGNGCTFGEELDEQECLGIGIVFPRNS